MSLEHIVFHFNHLNTVQEISLKSNGSILLFDTWFAESRGILSKQTHHNADSSQCEHMCGFHPPEGIRTMNMNLLCYLFNRGQVSMNVLSTVPVYMYVCVCVCVCVHM